MSSRWSRLRERKVVEGALAYLAGAWLLMQLVEVLADRWPLPLGLQRGIDLLLVVGFFVALTLAWYHGEKGRQRVTAAELLILAALLFIAGTLLTLLQPPGPGATAVSDPSIELPFSPDGPAIAVLPFRNLSGDPEQEYFVAGMHEALISSLSRIQALRVISRTSAMRYASTDQSIPEIAAELGVTAVIEGSVNPIGDQVRITVQLIDGQSDEHLWVEEYDRDLSDVLVLLSQVAESISEQVEVALAPEDAARLRSATRVDPLLHDLFMRGRYAFGSFSREGMAQSVEYFERAIQIDSTYALGWAGLSGAYVLSAYLGFLPALEGMDAAARAAVRALDLDPDLSWAHTALGWVRLYHFEWDPARRAFERALDLDPNDVDALHGLGDYLTITGKADEGLVYVRQARANDPFSPVWGHSVVAHLHMMHRFEEAIAEADDVLELYPGSPAWAMRGAANWRLGRLEEAMESFRKALVRRPRVLDAMEAGYASGGPEGAVRAIADASAASSTASDGSARGIALWYARVGDAPQTMAWLERAYEQQTPDLVYVGVRPEFDFLHPTAEFRSLLERMGLPAPPDG